MTAEGIVASERIGRFNRTERGVHWTQATSFLVLLVSGFVLALPAFESLIGHRALLREIHLTSAFVFFFGPAIIALAGDRRSMALDVKVVDTWDADDLRWLIPFPILRLFGVRTPPQGKFNAGQKLNAIFVVWCSLAFTVTGLMLWQNRRFPLDMVSQANTIHTVLAYVALAAFLGHLYLGTVHPQTRHAFRAITEGWVRVDWAEHHHPKWLHGPRASQTPPPHDAARTAGQIVLGSAVALFGVRILFFGIGANITDKVTSWLYDATAWPGVAVFHPATAVRIADWPAVPYLVLLIVAWVALDRTRQVRRPLDRDETDRGGESLRAEVSGSSRPAS
ncbi:MAG: formate dehydrogenase subunit gamma [Chloroflexota bacterium]